jgi:DNA-binding MarR family transcriptional regulator
MERILNKTVREFNKKKKYKDIMLSVTELHTIVAIGDNEGINLMNLAKLKGVTKGASSQMVYKLVKKGLVIKKPSEHSDKEIQLFLTLLGRDVYKQHTRFHKNNRIKISIMLDAFSDDTYNEFVKVLENYDKLLDS